MITSTRKCIHIPSVTVDADVSLDEFDTADIIKYLQDIGENASGATSSGSGFLISQSDLNHIETLAVCGQADAAKKLALQIISEAIGRTV